MIGSYLWITEKFVRLILEGGFWIVYIRFVRMVISEFLAQFPVDHFPHPVRSCLIPFFFFANLRRSVIIRMIVSFLSPHKLHLLFAAFYLFLSWYCWCLLRCSVLLSWKIQFVSEGFPFLDMSKFSSVRFRLFVAWNIHKIAFLPTFVFFWILCCLCCF